MATVMSIPGGVELYEVDRLVLALWEVAGGHCNHMWIIVIQTSATSLDASLAKLTSHTSAAYQRARHTNAVKHTKELYIQMQCSMPKLTTHTNATQHTKERLSYTQ